MREILFIFAFIISVLQFLLSIWRLKGIGRLIPLGISLLSTFAMEYIVHHSQAGAGTFPFPSGFGILLFLIACTGGIILGLIAWFCWYIVFQKISLNRIHPILSCALFIVLQLMATIYVAYVTF